METGYIITENIYGAISYIRLSYGSRPPYYAYKYCSFDGDEVFKSSNFKKFVFDKQFFKRVGIATDGIKPIAKGDIDSFELKRMKDKKSCEAAIIEQRYLLYDDLTLGIFNDGGK